MEHIQHNPPVQTMATSLIYTFLFFFTAFMLLRLYYSTRPTTTKNLPPSPPKLPIIGNLHQLGPLLHRSLFSLSRRYGADLMLFHFGSIPTLVASSAQAAREIMQTHDLKFVDKPSKETSRILFYGSKELSVSPYDEHWRQGKKLIVLNYLSVKKVQTYNRVRDEEIATAVHKIRDFSKQNKRVNVSDFCLEFSQSVSGRAAFGKKLFEETGLKVFKELSLVISRLYIGDLIPQLAWIDRIRGATGRLEAAAKLLDEFMESIIEERLSGKITHDLGEGVEPFIDALLTIYKESGVKGFAAGREGLKALLMDAYFAGADTSSTLLEWTMAELLAHPSALKKVQAEVRTIVNGKQQITDDDVDQMKYLKAVVMETARLHPPGPVPFPRVATEDVKVMGYDVEKGTSVVINVWGIGRDPTLWDKPDEFVPERFIGSSVDYVNHNFQLLLFGAGRRGCPGRVFALNMDEMFMANMLYHFDWALPDDQGGVNMDEKLGVTCRKLTPLLPFATPYPSSGYDPS